MSEPLSVHSTGGYVRADDPGEPQTGSPRISITDAEGELLAEMMAGLSVLEIGTGLGVSTRAMAKTAREVVSVDVDEWVSMNIAPELGQIGTVTCCHSIPRNWTFDAAFIDGDHSPAAVERDIRAALAVVRPGGFIVLHDFNASIVQEGARRAGIECEALATTYGLGVHRIPGGHP